MRLTTTTQVWLRAPLCVVLALWAVSGFEASPAANDQATVKPSIALAPAAQSTSFQSNRSEQRLEQARQRTFSAFLFILPSESNSAGDAELRVPVAGYSRPHSHGFGTPHTGRSPPAIS